MHVDVLESVGRYEIVGELGAGSMSRVYLANDPNLDRKVAVKVVLQGFSLDNREQGELERRFLLEARAAGKLSHPGIVRVYDADTDPATGLPYMAMEWVQGRSLRSLLDDSSRLSGPRTLEILAQVARALDYAHRAGRIHRDIKPSNILISTDGTAKVSDFGVAKIVAESHTISGQVLGTPAYMSPEQVKDDPLDGRSDLFSLGAVLYQCVSGITPFCGESLVQVVYKILNVDPRPLQLAPTPALTQLSGVVERSLRKDPNSRFQTGSDFAGSLDQIRKAIEADPHNDFRDSLREHKGARTSSDTIPAFAAQTAENGTEGDQTHTVQLSTTSIHRAARGPKVVPPQASGALETVATSTTLWRPDGGRGKQLTLVAIFLLALSVLGVSAIFRREEPMPATQVEETDSASVADEPSPQADEPFPQANPPVPPVASPSKEAQQRTRQHVTSKPDTPPDTAPPAVALTPVTILYKHKGGRGFLSILLDDVRVWSQELKPVEGRLQKLTGYDARAVVPVPSGTHTLQVNLNDPDRGVQASNSIRSRYTNGKKRKLRVSVDRKDNTLQLRWKE